jgi:c-di-GMP-binding flagellar brake protein YcgR
MKDRTSERIEFLNLNGANEPKLFDLSKTGVCVFSAKKLEKGAFAYVKFNTLQVKARVIYWQERSDGFRIGMQFCEISSDQQKALSELVDKFSRGVPISCSIEG